MDDAQSVPADFQGETNEPATKNEDAFLILENTRVFLLTQDVVNIGRRIENHLVIDDPRVSRNHAQLRIIHDHYVLFDLGSTGGTFINGRRIEQSTIYSGDVISLAGVQMVFKQNAPAPRPDLKETDRF